MTDDNRLAALVQELSAKLATAEKELTAARAYIVYTHEAYIPDSEQQELWEIWHEAHEVLNP